MAFTFILGERPPAPASSPVRAPGAGLHSSSRTRSRSGVSDRLSVIMENGDPEPPRPSYTSHASHRAWYQTLEHGDPPHHAHDRPPPPYTRYASKRAPGGEKFDQFRNKKFIARRGGWKRLAVVAAVAAVIIAALVAGIVVGLRKKRQRDEAPPPAVVPSESTSAPQAAGPFPQGSWTFRTYLDTVGTGCVKDPSAFTCFPYQTYRNSPARSAITFNWIITAAPGSSDLTISSSDNPFALTFLGVPLRLVDEGRLTERYTFEVPMDKLVIPTGPIGGETARLGCYFNDTTFEARLYTKSSRADSEEPSASPSPSSLTTSDPSRRSVATKRAQFQPWPHPVHVEQVIQGGPGVPRCYRMVDGRPREQVEVDLEVASGTGTCRCLYRDPRDRV